MPHTAAATIGRPEQVTRNPHQHQRARIWREVRTPAGQRRRSFVRPPVAAISQQPDIDCLSGQLEPQEMFPQNRGEKLYGEVERVVFQLVRPIKV